MHMSENKLPVFAPLSSKAIDRKKCSLVPRPPLVHTNGWAKFTWKRLCHVMYVLKENKCV